MKGTARGLVGAVIVCGTLLVLAGATLWAQEKTTKDQDINSLLERFRQRRAAESAAGAKRESFDLSSPEERRKSEAARDESARVPRERRRTAEDYLEEARSGGNPLERYRTDTTARGLLDKLRESEEEALGEKKEEEAPGKQPDIAERGTTKSYRNLVPDYSPEKMYGLPEQGGMIGQLPGDGSQREGTVGRERGTAAPRQLPDVTTETKDYAQRMVKDFGARGAIPDTNVDPRLLDIQERQRFSRWLKNDAEALVDPKATASTEKLYESYQQLSKVPLAQNYQSYRDTYVPYSQNFLNPTQRGTIYNRGYITDPAQRNYVHDVMQSKYSNDWYYNLDVGESWQDYYTREFGVNNSFVPFSSSRFYELNTLKQWSDMYRRDYGIDIRSGNYSYSDLYRLHTSKPTK